MSLASAREADAVPGTSNTDAFPSHSTLDASIFDHIYEAHDHVTMVPNPKQARPDGDAPELPIKSALRASRLLDNLGLKLGGSISTAAEPGQTTPLDVYLSSEEDASSDADDFSDYGYDSSVEDPASPSRWSRNSHEDTARVVSVVYSGKPSIVDLTQLRRRSLSPNAIQTRTRTWPNHAAASQTPTDRPSTPASTASSPVQTARKSSLLSSLLVKKRPPPFLSIDPFASGSTYSLDLTRDERADGESPVKAPRTPTQLLKGVSRTLSLVKKRSRPLLHIDSPQS